MYESSRQHEIVQTRLKGRHMAWVVTLTLFLIAVWNKPVDAQESACEGEGVFGDYAQISESWYGFVSIITLPNGQDYVSCRKGGEFEIDIGDGHTPDSVDPIQFVFLAEGDGPFEATVTVEFSVPDTNLGNSEWPLGVVTSARSEGLIIDSEDSQLTPNFPAMIQNGQFTWQETGVFTSDTYTIRARFEDQFLDWVHEHPLYTNMSIEEYDLILDVRMTLRRIKGPCYMETTVTGGRGAGTYAGHVAVLGSPTGVSDEDLNMWFGDPSDTSEGQQLQALENVMNSNMGQQAMQGMSAEDRAALDAFYGASETAAQEADPIGDIRDMLALTLQDVRFDEEGPSAELGGTEEMAMAYIANKFVLSAQLGASLPTGGFDENGRYYNIPVENVGLKGPGLGLAGTMVERCNVPTPTMKVKPCGLTSAGDTLWTEETDPNARWAQLDRMGFVCGELDGQVCHENGDTLTIHAEFQAARSLEDCIQ